MNKNTNIAGIKITEKNRKVIEEYLEYRQRGARVRRLTYPILVERLERIDKWLKCNLRLTKVSLKGTEMEIRMELGKPKSYKYEMVDTKAYLHFDGGKWVLDSVYRTPVSVAPSRETVFFSATAKELILKNARERNIY